MPELPEVEVCARSLRRWCTGKPVAEALIPDPCAIRSKLSTRPSDGSQTGAAKWAALTGQRTRSLERHGKRIRWDFDDSVWLLHLGMTGKWVAREADADPPRFGKLGLRFDDGMAVWFIDPRRFGCVTPVTAGDAARLLVGTMGPDALKDPLDGNRLQQVMSSRKSIKNALMDQTKVAGVGNIQAVEALWRARIDPTRAAMALTSAEYEVLAASLLEQLTWTIAAEDEGEIQYVSEQGSTNPFQVYGRKNEPCSRCGSNIVSVKDAGRTTFWCEKCQR